MCGLSVSRLVRLKDLESVEKQVESMKGRLFEIHSHVERLKMKDWRTNEFGSIFPPDFHSTLTFLYVHLVWGLLNIAGVFEIKIK